MEKLKILEKVLIYDRLLRFTIDLLSGIRSEVKADLEEVRILSESFLKNEEKREIREFLRHVNSEFLTELNDVLERIYDQYELFNFDITFLSGIPEEVEREISRLNIVEVINGELEKLRSLLEKACCDNSYGENSRAVLAPFLVYCRLINHAIEFNKKFENF